MVDAQSLKRRLKTVRQMEVQNDHRNQINPDNPNLFERSRHRRVKVFYLDALITFVVRDDGQLVRKFHFKPKIAHVQQQKEQHQRPQQRHILRSPRHALVAIRDGIFLSFCGAILEPERNADVAVQQNEEIQPIRNGLNEWIVRHKIGIHIERLAAVIFE